MEDRVHFFEFVLGQTWMRAPRNPKQAIDTVVSEAQALEAGLNLRLSFSSTVSSGPSV